MSVTLTTNAPRIAAPLTVKERFEMLRAKRNSDHEARLEGQLVTTEAVTLDEDGIARVSYSGRNGLSDRSIIAAAILRTTNGPCR